MEKIWLDRGYLVDELGNTIYGLYYRYGRQELYGVFPNIHAAEFVHSKLKEVYTVDLLLKELSIVDD